MGGNDIESETVTWDEERSSDAAIGGGLVAQRPFCVLMSLKSRVRAEPGCAARVIPTSIRTVRKKSAKSILYI